MNRCALQICTSSLKIKLSVVGKIGDARVVFPFALSALDSILSISAMAVSPPQPRCPTAPPSMVPVRTKVSDLGFSYCPSVWFCVAP